MGRTPRTREWIKLDAVALKTGSAEEWRKALSLAKSFGVRWARALGGDLDDFVQDALQHLAQRLRASSIQGAPPESVLLQYLACRARNAVRDRLTHERLLDRHADQVSPAAQPAPDEALDDRRWAEALDAAIRAERDVCDAEDARILDGTLLGLSLGELEGILGIPKTTIHTRLKKLRGRLEHRVRELMTGS